MGKGMSLHANYAGIEQLGADIGTHATENENIKANARSIASKACEEMGYGAGSSEHAAVMRKLEGLFEEHGANLNLHKTGTMNAGDTFQAAGQRMRMRMSQSQV